MRETAAVEGLLRLHNPPPAAAPAPAATPTFVHAWPAPAPASVPVPVHVQAWPLPHVKRPRATPANEVLYRGSNSISLHALADELCRRTPNVDSHSDIRALCSGFAMNLMTLDCFCALMMQVTPAGVFQNLSKDLTRVATLRARWRFAYAQTARARALRRARMLGKR